MKIKPSDNSNILNKYNQNKAESNDAVNNKNNKSQEKLSKDRYQDKVDISKNYKVHNKALEKLKKADAVERKEKLQTLKTQIQEDKYEINPEEIAKSIIDKLS